jgi:molecular chaperone IbpA
MTHFDFSPLYRSSIGFDKLSDLVEGAMQKNVNQPSYPPYNIELLEDDKYRITMAIAGFKQADIAIVLEKNVLTINGQQAAQKESKFLYQGIAGRNFEQKFQLADHVKVTRAVVEDGLLHIELHREIPEILKPRKIEIETVSSQSAIEGDKAA